MFSKCFLISLIIMDTVLMTFLADDLYRARLRPDNRLLDPRMSPVILQSFLLTNSLELQARVDGVIEPLNFAANMRNVGDFHAARILVLGASRRKVDKYFNPRICRAIFLRPGEREARTEERWRIFCRRRNKIALLSSDPTPRLCFGLIDANLGRGSDCRKLLLVARDFSPDCLQKVFLKFLPRSLDLNGIPCCYIIPRQLL